METSSSLEGANHLILSNIPNGMNITLTLKTRFWFLSLYSFCTELPKLIFRGLRVKILGTHALITLLWRQFVLNLFLRPSRAKGGRAPLWVCPSPHVFQPAPVGPPLCITFTALLALWFPVGLPKGHLQHKEREKRGVRSALSPRGCLELAGFWFGVLTA